MSIGEVKETERKEEVQECEGKPLSESFMEFMSQVSIIKEKIYQIETKKEKPEKEG